jgi:hypothetical protein
MNELNLQNPDFRELIRGVDINSHEIRILCDSLNRKNNFFLIYLYSKNGPLDENQHWFANTGRKLINFEDLKR